MRLNYILAQIYQYSNQHSLAQKHYELVLKSNPEYEMAFNAKMNLARSLEAGNPDTKRMKDTFLKMVKDDKNKEYLDQIYYTIAEMEISNNDTVSAIQNYTLSTINSVDNNSQKALSFLALGKLFFESGEYRSASINYDSTIFYMDSDFRLYEDANERHLILKDLVANLNIVEMQDSLQMLAKLPKAEQSSIISAIIQREVEKERQEAEEERLKQQMIRQSGVNSTRDAQFGNKTSGGKWYFYNPATLSFGMSEFRKKWGKRKLEDDWRRKNKKISNGFEADSTALDSAAVETQNTKDPKYYLNQLPKTKADFEASNKQIKEALYQLGTIYKESLGELILSSYNFEQVFLRFPSDTPYSSLSLYNVYLNHKERDDSKSQNAKKQLQKNYPNSIYNKMIIDPGYQSKTLSENDLAEVNYQIIFNNYNNDNFELVISKTNDITNGAYRDKLLLLRAFSFIKQKQKERAVATLREVSNNDEKTFQEAQYLLEAIKNPSAMTKANEIAVSGSPYLFRPKNNT